MSADYLQSQITPAEWARVLDIDQEQARKDIERRTRERRLAERVQESMMRERLIRQVKADQEHEQAMLCLRVSPHKIGAWGSGVGFWGEYQPEPKQLKKQLKRGD